ncbi:hypothetical protein GL267_014475 [Acidithiobacillus ferrianus]|uniref:Uncharacterized protein n=1 Tax=Acidithiobacillus ferrianus TaxID=2678518 RepID=A0ACD5HA39_9PROT|nr:hypothetical protein [Acidithiobacillus ferrianus]
MTKSNGNASDPQCKLAAALPPDEPEAGSSRRPESIPPRTLLAQVLDRENLRRALKQVRRNKGAPGIDGMSVDELPEYLKQHWPGIRAQQCAKRGTPASRRMGRGGRRRRRH